MYSTGNHSYRTVLHRLNSQGYTTNRKEGRRPWTKEALKHTLSNPFYVGKVRHKGKLYQGRHEPLVDDEVFERCQEVKRLHGRSPRTYVPKFRTYAFSGVLRCSGCGERMRADYGSGHKYYRCTSAGREIDCPAPRSRVREDSLEGQIGQVIRSLALPSSWQDRVIELYGAKDERDRILGEQKRLREKHRRLVASYHEVEISEEYYKAEKARTERELARLRLPDESRLEEIESLVQTLATSWDHATAEERRDMIRLMFDAVFCDPSAKRLVALQPKPDFVVLFRRAGMLQEKEGLVWPSDACEEQAGISAPDWTRTSTPLRAQALNLPRIPIPPQGL